MQPQRVWKMTVIFDPPALPKVLPEEYHEAEYLWAVRLTFDGPGTEGGFRKKVVKCSTVQQAISMVVGDCESRMVSCYVNLLAPDYYDMMKDYYDANTTERTG